MSDQGTVVQFLAIERDLSVLQSCQTAPRSRPSSYSVGCRGSLLEVKRPGREADLSLNLIVILRISLTSLPLPHMPSWREEEELQNFMLQNIFFFLLRCVEVILREC